MCIDRYVLRARKIKSPHIRVIGPKNFAFGIGPHLSGKDLLFESFGFGIPQAIHPGRHYERRTGMCTAILCGPAQSPGIVLPVIGNSAKIGNRHHALPDPSRIFRSVRRLRLPYDSCGYRTKNPLDKIFHSIKIRRNNRGIHSVDGPQLCSRTDLPDTTGCNDTLSTEL